MDPGGRVHFDAKKLKPRLTHYILHAPHIKQRAALLINRRELLFGGAGGGGKSDMLLMAALQYADCPDYGAIIFRRTYVQLKQRGGLIPRAMEWLEDTDAVGAEKDSGYFTRWDFPSGATLGFQHMQNFSDKENQQGGDWNFVGIDELGQFKERMITYMFSRLRRQKGSKIPTRLRATANPGGEGHDFICQRYGIPPAIVSRMIVHPTGRIFFPSKLIDNPSIDREDYLQSLANMDPVARAQIEYGDWSAREAGDMFRREWWQMVDAAPKQVTRRLRFWDLAATKPKKAGDDPDWSVGTLMSVRTEDGERKWCIEDVIRFREDPATTRKRVKLTARQDGPNVTVGIEEEGGSSGKIAADILRKDLAGSTVRTVRPTGDKSQRAGPLATAAESGAVEVVRGAWVASWLGEMDVFATPGVHDDQVDSASGAYTELVKGSGFADWYGEDAA